MEINWITVVSAGLLFLSALLLALMVYLQFRSRANRQGAVKSAPDSPVDTYSSIYARLNRQYYPEEQDGAQEGVANTDNRDDGIGDRLGEMEQQLRLLAERQDQLDLRQPANHSYKLAIKLARNGTNADELVRTCGISRGEAELVVMLHKSSGPIPSV
jgi:hypothetical protein